MVAIGTAKVGSGQQGAIRTVGASGVRKHHLAGVLVLDIVVGGRPGEAGVPIEDAAHRPATDNFLLPTFNVEDVRGPNTIDLNGMRGVKVARATVDGFHW